MALSVQSLTETRAAFDGVASDYGRQNEANPILAAMRERTMAAVMAHAPAGGQLLDLGCGPGTDAITLAHAGFDVMAIDASRAMVDQARARVRLEQLEGRVTVRQIGIHELAQLPSAPFDGVYSDFGPLNCVPRLGEAARQIAARLRPGACLVASVIGRVCPWELALYAARRDWPRLRVRFAPGFVAVPLDGGTVWTRYYTPRVFTETFEAAGFARVSLRSLGLLVPPPYLEHVAHRHPRALARLQQAEDLIAGWPALRSMGDHFLIVLART